MKRTDNSLFWIIGGAIVCVMFPPLGVLVMCVVVWLLVSSFFTEQNKED